MTRWKVLGVVIVRWVCRAEEEEFYARPGFELAPYLVYNRYTDKDVVSAVQLLRLLKGARATSWVENARQMMTIGGGPW